MHKTRTHTQPFDAILHSVERGIGVVMLWVTWERLRLKTMISDRVLDESKPHDY